MRGRAPGKVVLSGAYSVLHGAPAIVCAVDRYAVADTSQPAEWIGEEVREAFGESSIPHADASELRLEGRKLGLGSSAAVLVASLAAATGQADEALEVLRRRIQPLALKAHRTAQGGGSGIDVLTSVWGGTLIAQTSAGGIEFKRASLPTELTVEVWASNAAVSTALMLKAVAKLEEEQPDEHAQLFRTLKRAACAAELALTRGSLEALLDALSAQRAGLASLGQAADVPIVTSEVEQLAQLAHLDNSVVLPAGAGGGDIILWLGRGRSGSKFERLAHSLNHRQLTLSLEAPGVHILPERD